MTRAGPRSWRDRPRPVGRTSGPDVAAEAGGTASAAAAVAPAGIGGGGCHQEALQSSGHGGAGRIPPQGVRVQRTNDDGIEGHGHVAATRARRRGGRPDPGKCDGRGGVTGPRPEPGQSLVQHEAEAVHIGRRRGRVAASLLRAEVLDGAQDGARHRSLGVVGEAGDAEVGDQGTTVAGQQDVPWLDVPMDDPATVRHTERTCHVEPDPGGLGRGQHRVPAQSGRQILTVHQRHDQVRAGRIRTGVQARDDVRVMQRRRGEGLAPEPLDEVAIRGDLRAEQLDRDDGAEPLVASAIDGGHATATDDRFEPVAAPDEAPDLAGRSSRIGRAGLGHDGTIAHLPESDRRAWPDADPAVRWQIPVRRGRQDAGLMFWLKRKTLAGS